MHQYATDIPRVGSAVLATLSCLISRSMTSSRESGQVLPENLEDILQLIGTIIIDSAKCGPRYLIKRDPIIEIDCQTGS